MSQVYSNSVFHLEWISFVCPFSLICLYLRLGANAMGVMPCDHTRASLMKQPQDISSFWSSATMNGEHRKPPKLIFSSQKPITHTDHRVQFPTTYISAKLANWFLSLVRTADEPFHSFDLRLTVMQTRALVWFERPDLCSHLHLASIATL